MKKQNIITTLTTGTFIMIMVTGLLMLFEISFGTVRVAHKWMGILFILVAFLHIALYWHTFLKYFSTGCLFYTSCAVVSGLVLFSFSYNDIRVAVAAFDLIISFDLDTLVSVLNIDANHVSEIMEKSGVVIEDYQKSLLTIAKDNALDVDELIELLFQAKGN